MIQDEIQYKDRMLIKKQVEFHFYFVRHIGTYVHCTTVSKKPLKDSERYTRIESICVLHKTTLEFLRLFSAPQQETLAIYI